MSLPTFPEKDQIPSRDEAVNQIISSIAMEELGLSHIINAEGEKIQYALGTIPGVTGPAEPLTMEALLKLNESVQKTLDSTMMNQFFLKEKLEGALSASVLRGPTGPTGPQGPATIDVTGTADSLEPGAKPYVTNEGTPENALLRFGIPRGDTGEPGPTGSFETGQPLFSVSGETGSGSVSLEGSIAFVSDTLSVSVETGPAVRIEEPERLGAVVCFSSGASQTLTTSGSGARFRIAVIGQGGNYHLDAPSDPINNAQQPEFAFPMPADGTIRAFSVFLSLVTNTGLIPSESTKVTAALYRSTDPPNNLFEIIPETATTLFIHFHDAVGTVYTARTDNIGVRVNALDHLMMVVSSATAPEYNGTSTIGLYMSGAVQMV